MQTSQWSGLILASRNGHLDVVKALLDNGANINKESDVSFNKNEFICDNNFPILIVLEVECKISFCLG